MKLKLKNYRVIQKIGHGGMGLVYVAEDLALGRLVALKVLAPYLVQDPEILARFRTEARNQARLVHANITMVYSFLEEDQQAFLVLEFIDGETLESRINREGRIAAVEAVAIFRKILAAIAYAHSKGVIHRDIKPSNIAFTSDGHVKLMDFGIALNIEEGGRLTRTGHVMGTPHYMAPEQILGQEVTFATDIYALGITLYEMLTGRLPFDSKSDYEVRIAQVNHPPPPPRSFGHPDITPELEEVILKSLAKAAEERFASAGEFLQALEESVGRDHLVTVVKGLRLDRTTQAVKKPRKSAPPPSEPEMEERPAPAPEPEIEESAPALASPTAEPIVPLAAEVPPEEHPIPLSLGPQMEASPVSPLVRPHEEDSPALKLSEGPELSGSLLVEALEEPRVSAPADRQGEEHPAPPPETRLEKIVVPPLIEPQPEESVGHPEAEKISELPSLEPVTGLPVSSLADPLITEPPTPPPETLHAEPAVPTASVPQREEPPVSTPAEAAREEPSASLSLEPQPGEAPGPPPSEGQEISLSQPPEQLEELLAPPPPEPRLEAPPAPPAEGQMEEISAPLFVEPQPEESLPVGHPEVQADSGAVAAGQIAELGVPSHGEPGRAELLSPPPGAPGEDHFGPPPLGQPLADAVSPPDELPPQAPVLPSPLAPPVEEPAERLLEEPAASPPPEEIDEPSSPPLFEPPGEAPSGPAPEASMTGPLAPPSPEVDRQEPFTPSLSGPQAEEVLVPPPVEVPREVAEPKASPSMEQLSPEPATLPAPAGPFATPEVQRGRPARSRLIFLPLALLPLLAITILFRANIFPGPSVTPKAMLSPPPGATTVQQGAPPAQQPEEKIPVAAAKPPAQPLNPVSKEAAVSTGAESDKMVRDQAEKKEPVTVAALPPAEPKKETPEVKEPNPVDLQKTIKERLAADGFPDLQVLMDAKKGAVISGKVKNLEQKNRVIRMVNSMGLSTPVDYSNLKIIREVVVETTKKKVPEERPRITRTPETPPRPAAPEAPHKPLPPRLDRGNIQF